MNFKYLTLHPLINSKHVTNILLTKLPMSIFMIFFLFIKCIILIVHFRIIQATQDHIY